MKTNTQKIVTASMLASLCCVATMIIKIPSPLKGYINLGDCVVLLSGWLLSPIYAFLAAGIGSALADFFSGYMTYVPATFVIKGSMAAIVCCYFKTMNMKQGKTFSRALGGTIAETVMVLGYFVFEGFLYGFAPSVVNILPNVVQGVAGIIIGLWLVRVFDNIKM